MWAKHKQQSGFTIVELLIVIVVIAILGAISIVAYNGIQQRARDTQRKSDVGSIIKALGLYNVDKGAMYIGSGCGAGGNGDGWFNYNYAAPGSDVNECLKTQNYISGTIKDPANVNICTVGDLGCRKYIKYTCVQNSITTTYIFANLESVGHTANDTDGTCASNIDTDYGMNYFVKMTH